MQFKPVDYLICTTMQQRVYKGIHSVDEMKQRLFTRTLSIWLVTNRPSVKTEQSEAHHMKKSVTVAVVLRDWLAQILRSLYFTLQNA